MTTSIAAVTPPPISTAKRRRLAPATKNIVKAVSVMTIVVPRSGSLKTSPITGRAMMRNGIVPLRKPPIALPLFAIQWARYTISASLAISAGWTAGSGPRTSQRADPPTTRPSDGTKTRVSRTRETRYPGTDTRRSQR